METAVQLSEGSFLLKPGSVRLSRKDRSNSLRDEQSRVTSSWSADLLVPGSRRSASLRIRLQKPKRGVRIASRIAALLVVELGMGGVLFGEIRVQRLHCADARVFHLAGAYFLDRAFRHAGLFRHPRQVPIGFFPQSAANFCEEIDRVHGPL